MADRTILFATTNSNKIQRLRNLVRDLPVKIVSLDDMGLVLSEPTETASAGISIAAEKALAYLDQIAVGIPVLTQDDTIIFTGVDAVDNPGPAIKAPVIAQFGTFSDEHALTYYTDLAKRYGGTITMTFRYGHAIALRETADRDRIKLFAAESTLPARLVDTAHLPETVPGYFLAAIMQLFVDDQWQYHTALTEAQRTTADADLRLSIISLLKEADIA